MPLVSDLSQSHLAPLDDFFENGAIGLHIVGPDGAILRANKAELALLGYTAEEYVGRHIGDFHADPDTIADILARLGRGEVLDKYPARLKTKSGDIKHVLISSSVFFDEAGHFRNTRCFTVDVTERIQAEEEKQLLMDELSHRVKNTFAAVQAIAAQTLRSAGADLETFQNRLMALSRAHDMLLQKDWTGATMRPLVEKVLRIEAEGQRFEIDGPDVSIGPKAALSLSLLLHEMATNAVKYGALSADNGRVEVSWRLSDELFEVDWREVGGPPACEPHEKGFGSRLIGLGINGNRMNELVYGPDGLRARFIAPLSSLDQT